MPILYGFTGPVDLLPGGHVVVFGSWEMGLEGRRRGLELRDTLLVVGALGPPRFAFLFRRDLSGSTVAETVLKYGTGGLNVDGCRVGSTKRVPGGLSRTPGQSLSGSVDGSLRRETGEEGGHNPNVGRWPTNLVFVHAEGCKRDGVKTVRGTPPTPSGFDRYNKALQQQGYRPGEYQMGEPPTPPSRVDSSGQETIPNWICVEDCPVRALDEQSGALQGGRVVGAVKKATSSGHQGSSYGKENRPVGTQMVVYGDSGGASRFFPQFENEEALLTWLKILIGDVQS